MSGGEQPQQGASGQMPRREAQQPATPEQAQSEASRMQLEASRLQLEASRKQLEATAAESKGQPGASPAQPQKAAAQAGEQQPHPHGGKAAPAGQAAPMQPGANAETGGAGVQEAGPGHLRSPEYLHVLINPMPVYGLAMGVLAMCIALVLRSRPAILTALLLIFVSGLSAWPVYSFGQSAYDRVKEISDPAGVQWLDDHMARGEKLIYAFYVLAAIALAGILAPLKWPGASLPLAIAALVLGIGTLGIGGWISYAGGHVRHEEFRFEPPPAKAPMEHHHDGKQPDGKQPEGKSHEH